MITVHMRPILVVILAWQSSLCKATCTDKKYTTVTGYFLQDEVGTDPASFDFRAKNFGLLNRTYGGKSDNHNNHGTQWQHFARQVAKFQHASPHLKFKVLFLGRHGEGYHNAAEAYYGTPAWNCFYSILNGNDTITWADAELTPSGTTQARLNHEFWASRIEIEKIPAPESFYTSPLTRCLQTANLTYTSLNLGHPFIPTVKELFREGISGHTCDRRRSKTYIRGRFSIYNIEQGFAEEDPLFEPLHAEPEVDQDIRSKKVLDDVIEHDSSTYISITSHSGEIASILRVIGHRPFPLSTGAIIPVLIQAEYLQKDQVTSSSTQAYTGICTCTSPPSRTATVSECTTATGTVIDAGSRPT